MSFSIRASSVRKQAATAAAAATLFGVLMEVLQGVAGTGRDFDPVDMVANLIGSVLGGFIFLALHHFVDKYFTTLKSQQ
ncbi:VanZ family protein [Lewinella aquimaris]|uniref:VanZ family protein n=1 Tax=Neolewinella aquimaris TaxID=1835722 RepID=A0A840E775_9BACT|nr:VanZ family protein [Neolewinella aquimaris]